MMRDVVRSCSLPLLLAFAACYPFDHAYICALGVLCVWDCHCLQMPLQVCHAVSLEFDEAYSSRRSGRGPGSPVQRRALKGDPHSGSKQYLEKSAARRESSASGQTRGAGGGSGAAGNSPRLGECHDWLMVRD